MTRRAISQVATVVIAAVFALGTLFTGGSVNSSWLRFYSVAVFVLVGLWTLWDSLLWRLPVAQRLKSSPANVRGTWAGELVSDWRDSQTPTVVGARRVYLVIRQTASKLHVSLLTDESQSASTAASLVRSDHETLLCYIYVDTPSRANREQGNQIHDGAGLLRVVGKPATRLTGDYWTSRKTGGELRLVERHTECAQDFDQARALFGD